MEKSGTIMHSAEMHLNEYRNVFIPIATVEGSNAALGAFHGMYAAAKLADSEPGQAYATLKVPANYISNASVVAIMASSASGDVMRTIYSQHAAETEAYNTHVDTLAAAANSIVADHFFVSESLTLTNLSLGDMLGFDLYRDGNNASDTLASILYVLGFVLTYYADQ